MVIMNRDNILPTVALSASPSQYLKFSKSLDQLLLAAATPTRGDEELEKKRPKSQLPEDFVPTETDVICGKGKHIFSHEGNRRFRQLVEMSLDRYSEANSRGKKTQVVDDIVEMVRRRSEKHGGGFVRQDETTGRWWEIGSQHAKEKVGHTIREALMQNEPHKQAERRKLRAINKARRSALRRQQTKESHAKLQDILSSCKVVADTQQAEDLHGRMEHAVKQKNVFPQQQEAGALQHQPVSPPTGKDDEKVLNDNKGEGSSKPAVLAEEDGAILSWFSPKEQHILGSMPADEEGFDEEEGGSS